MTEPVCWSPAIFVTVAGAGATVSTAVPVTVPAEARIVADPLATAVATPEEASMVATAVARLLQLTLCPAMVFPSWSRTVAVNWLVSPRAVIVAVLGEITTVVGTGGEVESPGQAYRNGTRRATANLAFLMTTRSLDGEGDRHDPVRLSSKIVRASGRGLPSRAPEEHACMQGGFRAPGGG